MSIASTRGLRGGPGRGGGGVRGGLRLTPPRIVVLGFTFTVAVGTLLLMLPAAHSGPGSTSFVEALFTATSAVSVTGLAVLDTGGHFSAFGEVVILGLIQIGGFGIMTSASLLVLLISRRLGMTTMESAATETSLVGLGDIRRVLVGVFVLSLAVEAMTAVLLTFRFALTYGLSWPNALWHGVFHAVSAFNNAGFGLFPDSLSRFATDAWICLPISAAVLIGGVGFPVLHELRRERRPGRWTIHTRITLYGSALLLAAGTALVLAAEWNNRATLGDLDTGGKLLNAFVQGGVMTRSAGFNTVDIGALNTGTWLGMDVLMFIGGGSAGTAGGIKVVTFFLLAYAILAEVRGDEQVVVFHRSVSFSTVRQALTIALIGVAAVVGPAIAMTLTTPFTLDEILFEVTSAFGNTGLSTGITADLPAEHQLLLVMLMFLGRVGTITLATALALRNRPRLYRLPEERPIIG